MSNNHSQQHPHNTNEETQISAITEIHYLPNMTLSDIEPFCIGTGTTPRRHLQCRYYRFSNKNIFQTWLEDRKQIVHWVCDKAKPGKHSINLEFMQFECNFAGSYTQTSLNHINTTNDQESNDNNNNNNNNKLSLFPSFLIQTTIVVVTIKKQKKKLCRNMRSFRISCFCSFL